MNHSKHFLYSRTFWLNAITFLVALIGFAIGQQEIAQHPKLVTALVLIHSGLNIVLRFITINPVNIMAFLVVVGLAFSPAQAGHWVTGEREAMLRRMIPLAEYRDHPRLQIYTSREMPPAYQFAGPGQLRTCFHNLLHNISGDPPEAALGHGFGGTAVDFPWRHPGGTDRTQGTSSFKFFVLPEGRPIVWYLQRRRQSGDNNLGVTELYFWLYPVGTRFGEVLTMRSPQGFDHTYELRVRERIPGGWAVDILRPYPTAESLLEAVRELPPFRGQAELVQHLSSDAPLPTRTLADSRHRSRRAFEQTASIDVLPPIDPAVVTKLLSRPFRSALGETWRGKDCYAPTTDSEWHIVPRGYDGTFLGNDQTSCRRCHESATLDVEVFDERRQWYGNVRGGDQILSFTPIDPACISNNGGPAPVRMLDVPGLVERYDPARHDRATYHAIELTPGADR